MTHTGSTPDVCGTDLSLHGLYPLYNVAPHNATGQFRVSSVLRCFAPYLPDITQKLNINWLVVVAVVVV